MFILSGLLEIGGGFLTWQALRSGKPWWWALFGSLLLALYGFAAALSPLVDFGRAYAIYGGVFIIMALLFGVIADGFQPDVGDIVGAVVVIVGIAIMLFYPRQTSQ